MKRLCAFSLTLLMCLMMFATTVAAVETESSEPPLTQPGQISVLNAVNGKGVQNAEVRIYRVADVENGKLTWTEKYAAYQLKLDPNNTEEFGSLPMTLAQYLKRDKVEADQAKATGIDGKAEFSNLSQGLYLIDGNSHTSGDYRYDVVPALVILPYLNDGSGIWQWKADLEVKHDPVRIHWPSTPSEPDEKPETTSIHVTKSWNDEEHEAERPLSVRVQLMKGDSVQETVTLNAQNNWRHTWTGLAKNENWYVIEQTVPANYSVEVEQEGVTFLVTNHYVTPIEPDPNVPKEEEPDVTPSPTPAPGETQDPGQTPAPTETPTGIPDEGIPTDQGPKIPQTGQPWALVIVLSIGGIVFALIGAIVLNKGKTKHRNIFAGMVGMGLAYVILAGGIMVYNIKDDERAEVAAYEVKQAVLQEMTEYKQQFDGMEFTPDYVVNETMEMPEVLIDGRIYIGTVSLPALDIELPVQTDCTAEGLKVSPGRYVGSVYEDDVIIGGHNYKSHFGKLGQSQVGDSVVFTDIDGNVFRYTVKAIETVDGYDIDGAKAGDWDLTLFTCTLGGKNRIMVRCDRLMEED